MKRSTQTSIFFTLFAVLIICNTNSYSADRNQTLIFRNDTSEQIPEVHERARPTGKYGWAWTINIGDSLDIDSIVIVSDIPEIRVEFTVDTRNAAAPGNVYERKLTFNKNRRVFHDTNNILYTTRHTGPTNLREFKAEVVFGYYTFNRGDTLPPVMMITYATKRVRYENKPTDYYFVKAQDTVIIRGIQDSITLNAACWDSSVFIERCDPYSKLRYYSSLTMWEDSTDTLHGGTSVESLIVDSIFLHSGSKDYKYSFHLNVDYGNGVTRDTILRIENRETIFPGALLTLPGGASFRLFNAEIEYVGSQYSTPPGSPLFPAIFFFCGRRIWGANQDKVVFLEDTLTIRGWQDSLATSVRPDESVSKPHRLYGKHPVSRVINYDLQGRQVTTLHTYRGIIINKTEVGYIRSLRLK